ncbi:MAG: gamma-glutamyltranspeptidase [Geminicoccaceae bacterium]|nr:MAG: gamma-glutamyltranspeptidase [Geminicoccaceae bacterium]
MALKRAWSRRSFGGLSMNANVEQWQVRKAAVTSEAGVVAAQHWLAARAGAAVLDEGGNAIDAAVATAFALGIVEPWMCGIGGAGYLVAWLADERRAVAIDFQGMLPQDIRLEDYPLDPSLPTSLMGFPGVFDNRHVEGPFSVLVPGAVSGLAEAVARFGTFGLDRVMAPSLRLAERGLPVDWHATLMIALESRKLAKDPAAAALFLPGGHPALPERYLSNPALLRTYRAIAEEGPGVVHGGRIGEAMARDLQRLGSRITAEDFAAYEARVFEAMATSHRGHTVYTAGETSGGVRLNEALGHVAEELDPSRGIGAHTYAVYGTALDRAFAAHERRLGRAAPATGCTSHLSVVDAQGNMVALTYTLLNRFGSGVLLPETGVLMNNSVSYFDPRPGFPTTMRGRLKINASNMCPTVVVKDGAARFAVGASGANHIVPCTFQLTALQLDYGLDLEQAFHTPRIDASNRGSLRVDPRVGDAVLAELGERFELEIAQQLVFPKLYACPAGVARDPATGRCSGIADVGSPIAGAAAAGPLELDDRFEAPTVRA